jgi:hypothetical protein
MSFHNEVQCAKYIGSHGTGIGTVLQLPCENGLFHSIGNLATPALYTHGGVEAPGCTANCSCLPAAAARNTLLSRRIQLNVVAVGCTSDHATRMVTPWVNSGRTGNATTGGSWVDDSPMHNGLKTLCTPTTFPKCVGGSLSVGGTGSVCVCEDVRWS